LDLIFKVKSNNDDSASNGSGGNETILKIILKYFKALLLSNNIDKMKLLLDSRASIYLIPFLNIENTPLRSEMFDIFELLSRGMSLINYSYLKSTI
jgi:hypothetical protein